MRQISNGSYLYEAGYPSMLLLLALLMLTGYITLIMYSPSNLVAPRLVDRSGEMGAPDGLPGMVPTACVIPGLRTYSIVYCDNIDRGVGGTWFHLHSLWTDSEGRNHWTDLTDRANRKASNKEGIKNPLAFVDTTRNVEIVLWNSNFFPVSNDEEEAAPRGDVWDHYYSRSENLIDAENLTFVAGVGDKASAGVDRQAVGFYHDAGNDINHVIFVGFGIHRGRDPHHLFWTGISRVQYGGNFSDKVSSPQAVSSLGSVFIGSQGFHQVLYRGVNRQIMNYFWKSPDIFGLEDLSSAAGTPPAQIYPFSPQYSPDPVGFYFPDADTTHVVYRGSDDHLYYIFWKGQEGVQHKDLTLEVNAPLARYNVCNFSASLSVHRGFGRFTAHVFFVTENDLHLHHIWWEALNIQTFSYRDLTATFNLPLARGRPAAFVTDFEGTNMVNHVAYRGNDNHIYELIW